MTGTRPSGLSCLTSQPTCSDGESPRSQQTPAFGQPLGTEPWEAAVELIKRADRILLICHVSPDGDAIGSLLGLGLGLRTLGKTPVLACESVPPNKFSFLPGYTSIENTVGSAPFDLVISLDSSDLSRLGSVYDANRLTGLPLVNIDHHITNLYFGSVNLVDPTAASAAELILTLLDHLNVPIGPTTYRGDNGDEWMEASGDDIGIQTVGIATCLLTGIVTDTLGFRTSNVTPRVMAAVMRLMEAGASLPKVTHHAFHQRPLSDLYLLAKGLNRIQTADGLAWSEIVLADRDVCSHADNGDAGLVGMLVRTKEIQIAAVFTERENNQVEISFRAAPGFDVAQLALRLGGGGHPAASGCTIEGPLESAKARVLPAMRTTLEEQRKSKVS